MAVSASEAGPSRVSTSTPNGTPTKKRIADFEDSSDEEEHLAIPNGHASTSSPLARPNGLKNGAATVNGKKRKMANGSSSKEELDEERKARKAEAERLFVTRQDLPFYQGELEVVFDSGQPDGQDDR